MDWKGLPYLLSPFNIFMLVPHRWHIFPYQIILIQVESLEAALQEWNEKEKTFKLISVSEVIQTHAAPWDYESFLWCVAAKYQRRGQHIARGAECSGSRTLGGALVNNVMLGWWEMMYDVLHWLTYIPGQWDDMIIVSWYPYLAWVSICLYSLAA